MTAPEPAIRVLVVDDSPVARSLWTRRIDAEPDMEVVAAAWTGRTALDVLRRMAIDVVLLDIEMPDMDGMTALPLMLEEHPHIRVVMVSSMTARGAKVTVQALSLGAADYVTKPQAGDDIDAVGQELVRKVRALGPGPNPDTVPADPSPRPENWTTSATSSPVAAQAIAMTSSTGGPNALCQLLGALPPAFPVPILIVQHMPPLFTEMLAQRLERTSGRACSEAQDGQVVEAGHTYVAPGDRHLRVTRSAGEVVLRVSDDQPVNFCRPSADPLFSSMASTYGEALMGVVLTGMGHDGLEGCRAIRSAGGSVVAQDQDSSVVWGMPGSVARAGLASSVLPLDSIASYLDENAGARR